MEEFVSELDLRTYAPPAAAIEGAHVSGMAAYRKPVAEAESDYQDYWTRLARDFLTWNTPFTKALDENDAAFYKWFEDGTPNVSYNCLDRNVAAGEGAKTAIIFEADDGQVTRVAYSELLVKTCQLANALKARGVKKGSVAVSLIG